MNAIRWLVILVVSSLTPAFASSLDGERVADKRAQAASEVKVRVWTVHATNRSTGIGDGLERIEKHLKNLNYSGFSLLSKDGAAIAPKASRKFAVVGDKAVKVTVLDRSDKRARVRTCSVSGRDHVQPADRGLEHGQRYQHVRK